MSAAITGLSRKLRTALVIAALVIAPAFIVTAAATVTVNPAGAAGILPPNDPPANINFDVQPQCSEIGDDSDPCIQSILHDINYGRYTEGVTPMVLPNGFLQMSDTEQLLVLANLERGDRGLSQFAGLSTTLDPAAQQGADTDTDPSPPNGYPWNQWGSNWADAIDPLESDFLWMYNDGVGGTNIDCQPGNLSGCWGHRNNILGPWITAGQQSANMGAYGNSDLFTQLFVDKSGGADSIIDPYWSVSFPSEVPPQVVQVSPTRSASQSAGTEVTIDGNYFSLFSNGQVPTVDFGSSPATDVHVDWDGELTAIAPADPAGGAADTVVVTVTTPAGTSDTTPEPSTDEFSYSATPTPSVTGVSPDTGPLAGGQQVTITGTNFDDTTNVDFGSVPATNFSVVSDQTITATVPAASNPGGVGVQVTTIGGTSGLSSLDKYTFLLTTSTTASVSDATPAQGTSITYSAEVTSSDGTPTGTVTFYVGFATLCTTGNLQDGEGSCRTSDAPPGADTVTASYAGNSTFASSIGTATMVVTSGDYVPLSPTRICDTRPGNPSGLNGPAAQCDGPSNSGSTIAPDATKVINVAGNFGVPADATAVMLNVTAISPMAPGFLTVFPTGSGQPEASNVNFIAGQVVPNLVEVGTGTSGNVSIFASSQTDVAVDVEGYVSPIQPSGQGPGLYNPLPSPARICDTRAGNPSSLSGADAQCNGPGNSGDRLGAGQTINVSVGGDNGVPANASAAVLNLTVANPAAAGYLTVYPEGGSRPTASNVNYTANMITNNRVIVPLSAGGDPGQVTIYSAAAADVVVDVSGYFSAGGGSGSLFTSEVAPERICDTRAGDPSGLTGGDNQCDGRTIGSRGTLTINVSGLAGVPTDATAVVVNLTGVSPTLDTYLTVFPGPSIPFTSDLNPYAGQVKANMSVATLSAKGTISIYNDTGSTNVVVDVLGWYS